MNHILIHTLFLLLLFTGCRLGPSYTPPCPPIPDKWKSPAPESSPAPVDFWWEIFDDVSLDNLERQAVSNNRNLFVALEKVAEARAVAGFQKADLYPQINFTPSYTSTINSLHVDLTRSISPAIQPFNRTFRIHEFQYTIPVNLSYEVDLWGKLQGQYDSLLYNAQAQEEALRVTLLTLTADLASSYFQMRSLDAQVDLLAKTIESRRKQFELTQSRYHQGLVSYLDVTNAKLLLTNAEAIYYDTVRQRTLQENMIATLIGMPASSLCLEHNALIDSPPRIPAGLPTDILLQRPDIAQAERNMAAEHALIGAAYASFFPSLEITGTGGYSSTIFERFLRFSSTYWSIGSNAAQIIFDGGRNDARVAIAKARYKEAQGAYQQQVLTAFQEVEDALNNIELQEKQSDSLAQSVQAAHETTNLTIGRYKNGLSNYLEVFVNEQNELETERSLAILLGIRYLSTIQLIKSLGGRW